MIPNFRAWSKKFERMYEVTLIDYENGDVGLKDDHGGVAIGDIKQLILMQSTGLKDKNDVEIFDGDVVNFMVPNQMISGTYQIRQAKSGEWRLDNRVQGRPLYISGSYHCEVVGNVWEDGDLLESVEE
ncbi:TPA: YopX family protein [Streptococcus agalactiae]